MGWVYLDDSFPEHAKIIAAGGDAVLLWVYGLAYCNRRLTEGRIPKAYVPQLTDRRKPLELAAKLVKVGLWLEDGDHYRVHDYDKWNHSATAKAKAKKAADARWKDKPKPDAQAHAQASGEHVPRDMPDGVLDDASRAPGPLAPSPYAPGVESVQAPSSVVEGIEGRGLNQHQRLLVARMLAACTATGPYVVDEAVEVVKHVTTHIDWTLVDEAIGWALEAEKPPGMPRYFVRACQRKASDHGLSVPEMLFPKARAS